MCKNEKKIRWRRWGSSLQGQIWRMFGAEYKQVDIMLGAGQVKLIVSIKREHGEARQRWYKLDAPWKEFIFV